jgi:hypothetical protein
MPKQRTANQNSAMHLWFKQISDECFDSGVTVETVIRHAPQVQVDEDFIKWLFRKIAKKKYGKTSTSFLDKNEIDPVVEEMVKFFAHQVDPPVELPPFPHDEEMTRLKTEGNLYNR